MAIYKKEDIPEDFLEFAPVIFVTNIMSHKWTLPIFLSIQTPMKFNQLQKKLGISHSVLSKCLKDMEELLLIRRTVITTTNPPAVEYTLTDYGRQMLEDFLILRDRWKEYDQNFTAPPNGHKYI